MKTRQLVLLGATILILSLASLFVFSQLIAQNSQQHLTQADSVDMMIRALGLENEFSVTATMMDKVDKLEELELAPPGGWKPERPLLKGDAAVLLAQILDLQMKSGAAPEEYVQELANQDIMTDGRAEEQLSQADLTTTINAAAAPPGDTKGKNRRGRRRRKTPPYRIPISPVDDDDDDDDDDGGDDDDDDE